MSNVEPGRPGGGVVVEAVGFAGDISTLWLYDESSLFAQASTVDDALRLIDEFNAQAAKTLTPDVAAKVDAIWAEVGQSLTKGELAPSQVRDMMRWLLWDQDLPGVNAADTAGRPLSSWLTQYAAQHGWRPPVPPAQHPAQAPTGPSHAARTVAASALKVRGQAVPAPGLDAAETAAISQAIGLAYNDLLGVVARTTDAMLPGMAPGQVPGALADLFRATRVLEHQVARAQAELAGKAPAHVGGQLHGAQQALHGLSQEVARLHDQLAETAPSTLHTHVQDNTGLIENLGKRVTHLGEAVVPTLAAGLTVVDRNLSSLNHLTAGISSGNLQHDLNTLTQEVRSKVEPAIQTLEDCCAENRAVTNPIREGAATPSLLRHLGSLLGKAFVIGWVATLAETALTVLDARLVVTDIAADTATVTDWAISAASVIESDLGWLGGLRAGA